MEHSLSRILIETTVRQTLKGLQGDPKRSTRNLVDMALEFSEGRDQCRFFAEVQAVLRQENSPYYALVQDVVGHVNTEHLVTFGMNLGYNSCTWGAERIRRQEKLLGYHIPWAVLLQMDSSAHGEQYHRVMEEGEKLGIYTWGVMAKGDPLLLLPLLERHKDSAFFLFCGPGYVTEAFLDAAQEMYNLMPVVNLGEGAERACALLRGRGIPYSVYGCYGRQDVEQIANGEWFSTAQRLHPIFTVLAARPDCPADGRRTVCQAVTEARSGLPYPTVPWELSEDTRKLDEAISPGAIGAAFDRQGNLYTWGGQCAAGYGNLFQDGLSQILKRASTGAEQ